jgi:hypothetical protein
MGMGGSGSKEARILGPPVFPRAYRTDAGR